MAGVAGSGSIFVVVGGFGFSSPYFMTMATWGSLLNGAAEIGLIALGTCLLIITGEFDLSVGANLALSGMVYALLTGYMSSPAALVITLFLGAMIGWFNAQVSLRLGLPSFIATLGSMLMLRGIALSITDGFPVSAQDSSWVGGVLNFEIFPQLNAAVLLWLWVAVLAHFLLRHSAFGNRMMATGYAPHTAFAMGVQTRKVKLYAFIGLGVLAAMSGVVQFEQLGSISPTAGEQYELRSIAIAVIGGTLLSGGGGRYWVRS